MSSTLKSGELIHSEALNFIEITNFRQDKNLFGIFFLSWQTSPPSSLLDLLPFEVHLSLARVAQKTRIILRIFGVPL